MKIALYKRQIDDCIFNEPYPVKIFLNIPEWLNDLTQIFVSILSHTDTRFRYSQHHFLDQETETVTFYSTANDQKSPHPPNTIARDKHTQTFTICICNYEINKKKKKLNDVLHRPKNINSLVSLPFGPYQQQWYNHGQTDLSFEFSDHTNSEVKQGRGSKCITL